MSIRIAVLPMMCRHFSASIKKNPSLEDASCIWQDSSSFTSEKGKVYELVLDVGLFPRRDTYKGREIIEKKLQIDPDFRSQVDNMKKLATERLSKLDKHHFLRKPIDIDHFLPTNLINHELLISKNGKRFECNAWVHSDKRQSIVEEVQEKKSSPLQVNAVKKLVKSTIYPPQDLLPEFPPFAPAPRWLKDHPKTSLRHNWTFWDNPGGGQYQISIWVHSVPEDPSAIGIQNLYHRIEAAGQPLKDKIEALKELAAERLSHVLEQRKPPIYIAAVKAAMIAEGEFPLCTDVHTSDQDIFEISAQVSMQPEHEAEEVNEALKNSALKCKTDRHFLKFDGMMIMYRNQIVGAPPDNILEGTMVITKRVEHTKFLLKWADEGSHQARKELGWLAWWEETTSFTDESKPAKWPPLQFYGLKD